jgi:hypothetical protein
MDPSDVVILLRIDENVLIKILKCAEAERFWLGEKPFLA